MKKSLADLPAESLRGKRALVRVDYNVPLEDGRVADTTRIEASLPTLRLLLDRGARPVLLSHLGRPRGQPDAEFSLAPVADALGELVEAEVRFVPECDGDRALAASRDLPDGAMLVLENTRFVPGETANNAGVARGFAALGDLFVSDAFGSLHRAHASTVGVAAFLRPAVAGLLVERELEALGSLRERPERPFVVAFGGAKISDKIELLDAFIERADRLLVGGAMANTFFAARGLETGRSLVESEALDDAREILERAGDLLRLPDDVVVTDDPRNPEGDVREVAVDAIPADMAAVDVGPRTREAFAAAVEDAGAFFWNGPMGMFEDRRFAAGTFGLAQVAARATGRGTFTVIGGGDSAAAVRAAGLTDAVSHVSTGGGASLEFLAHGTLPGIDALDDR